MTLMTTVPTMIETPKRYGMHAMTLAIVVGVVFLIASVTTAGTTDNFVEHVNSVRFNFWAVAVRCAWVWTSADTKNLHALLLQFVANGQIKGNTRTQ